MPIYAYLCSQCGFRKDVLQKLSDAALTVCPHCGAQAFAKQLSAPSFQLKGTGWYATDFKHSGTAGAAKNTSGDAGQAAKGDGNAGGDSANSAPAPAPAPAAPPAAS
ncbi:MAG: zinc ribbon domain-containing protein [Comamonadaceae bacterium]|nr:zinc ribbon domain-containing protein [Comamonadaceae bacterium]